MYTLKSETITRKENESCRVQRKSVLQLAIRASCSQHVLARKSFQLAIDRFHCHATKKLLGNRAMEEAKKTKCYKRLIYKQFVPVSGLCGPQFLSYLPKRFTHLCRALYGDAILVYRFGPPIWLLEINKKIWSSLFL